MTPDPTEAEGTLSTLQETPSGVLPFLLHIIPETFVGAFADGEIIQVLFVALLSAVALTALGERGRGIVSGIDSLGKMMFRIVHIVLYAAPSAPSAVWRTRWAGSTSGCWGTWRCSWPVSTRRVSGPMLTSIW